MKLPRRSGADEREAPAAPWGLLGTALGIVAVVNIWLLAAIVTAAIIGGPLEEASVAARYTFVIVAQLVFVVVPIGVAVVTAAGPESLGLRPYSFRALLEGTFTGALLVGLTAAYSWLLEVFLPALHEKMVVEHELQMELLEGSLPLLLFVAVVLAPLGEELFFRGFVFGGLRPRLGFAWASGLSAALFAGIHLMPWSLVPLFLVGLGTAVVYERHRSLAACMMAHASYNLLSLAVDSFG